jgi:hypothetical protein
MLRFGSVRTLVVSKNEDGGNGGGGPRIKLTSLKRERRRRIVKKAARRAYNLFSLKDENAFSRKFNPKKVWCWTGMLLLLRAAKRKRDKKPVDETGADVDDAATRGLGYSYIPNKASKKDLPMTVQRVILVIL